MFRYYRRYRPAGENLSKGLSRLLIVFEVEALVVELFICAIHNHYCVVCILINAFLSFDDVNEFKLSNKHSLDEQSHSIVDVVYVPKLTNLNLALKDVM